MSSITRFVVLFVSILFSTNTLAQGTADSPSPNRASQLDVVQSVLEAKLLERTEVRSNIMNAEPRDVADLEIELNNINAEIAELKQSFEQIAVGNVDLGIFKEDKGEFDWRTEVTEVMMPIIRNLQSLTEKPRKLEALRSTISNSNEQLAAATAALQAVDQNAGLPVNKATQSALSALQTSWKEQIQDIEREREVAQVQLANLQSNDTNIFETVKSGIIGFVTGRGLTLFIAFLAALFVWYVTKLFSKVLLSKSRTIGANTYKTRQRLVQYGFNILTGLLMTIAVIVVFYIRGDVLLLGLTLLLAGGALLGLRNTIPKFITEARLLLNLGSIRENERVVYNGLPYRVASLNMYSVLKNPELTGIIRLPLESLMEMISRPAGKEPWFPVSKGEYILTAEGKLLEVLDLTTELALLQNLAGTKTSIPTADLYNMTFDNISRGDSFSIISTFGIGYSHQDISNQNVPEIFKAALEDAFASKDYGEHIQSISVELKEAGASSLDYWICVSVASAGVRSYFKVNRVVQQTCVDTCTTKNWDIPFPQLTIHNQA